MREEPEGEPETLSERAIQNWSKFVVVLRRWGRHDIIVQNYRELDRRIISIIGDRINRLEDPEKFNRD